MHADILSWSRTQGLFVGVALEGATLADVVAHYNRVRSLSHRAGQQRDLVEFLKSL